MYLFKLIRYWAIKTRYEFTNQQARIWDEFGKRAIKNRNIPDAEIAIKKMREVNKKKDYLISKMEDLFAE